MHGFTLNVRGQEELNYQIMRQNLLEELPNPRDKRRNIDVVNPYFFTRDPTTQQLKVGSHTTDMDRCLTSGWWTETPSNRNPTDSPYQSFQSLYIVVESRSQPQRVEVAPR